MSKKFVSRLILIFVLANGLFFFAHLIIISQTLSDGVHINPNTYSEQWLNDGVVITVIDSINNGLLDGDIILEIEGQPIHIWLDRLFCFSSHCNNPSPPEIATDTTLNYTVRRNGEILTTTSQLRPYPFWQTISQTWNGITLGMVSYLMFLILLIKRPYEPSIIAMALASAGFLASSAWLFGVSMIDILNRDTFWIYQFAIHVCYHFALGGLLHFTMVFPKPLPLLNRYRWLSIFPYVAIFLILGTSLLSYALTNQNKLLWLAHANFSSTLADTIYYLLAGLAIIFNYRSLQQDTDRQKMRIVAFSIFLVMLLSTVLRILPSILLDESLVTSDTIGLFGLIVPISIVVSIQRHRLWNIDPLINRTFVYISLTAIIIGLYIILVVISGGILQTGLSLSSSVIATGIVAVMFQPIRLQLQNFVNRIMYGERDNPAMVLTRLAHHLERSDMPTAILPNLVQTIANTLKIPHVAIWLSDLKSEPTATYGTSTNYLQRLPLSYRNDEIGHLVFAQRAPQEPFNRQEEELLETIAALTATTVRAVQLSGELRDSRQRIITAREEERRRIRRDLHDGLGPQLASQTLGLEAIAQLIPTNPTKALALLESLKIQAHEAIIDIRRLVYDLRPPALDDLGLVGALQQSVARYETAELHFNFQVDEPLSDLPAAIETAIYRITQEAITNIVRHAQATHCSIRLYCQENNIIVDIQDNGVGLPEKYRSGVGLQAMVERATELNGETIIQTLTTGGTRIYTRLPLEVYLE